MNWHVVTVDRYVAGPYPSKKEAVAYCKEATLDPRKQPRFRHWREGLEYVEHQEASRERRLCLNIVTDEQLPAWGAAHEQAMAEGED